MGIDNTFVNNFLFPFALIMVMFRIGLSLDLDHLPKVLKNKRALITGLFLQLIVLPLLGFLIVILFDFSFEIEAGIIVITVCPGGWVSNMVSTKLKGDVDLSISLTTFSTLLSVFSAPFYLFLLLFFFYPTHYENFSLYLVVGKISLWVVIPVLLGLIIHYRSVQIGSSLLKIIRPTSIIFILLIVIAAAIEEGEHFAAYFKKIGLILFGLNVSAMVLSYYFAKMMKCRPNQWMIIAIETGVQNSALAIVMGVSIMNSIFVAIPPTIYTLIMFSSVSFVLFFHNQKEKV